MKQNIFDIYANLVAKQFHLTLDQMFSKSQRRDIVDARQMLYFICMERPIRLSYLQRFMQENGCDVTHSTIIHGYKRAKKLIEDDSDYKEVVRQIESKDVSV